MRIELEEAALSDKAAMFDMMQGYIAEFSAFEPTEPDEWGIYPYQPFDSYWEEPERHPFFILADGQRAGLALVNRNHYVHLWHPSRSIAEFYIMPGFRRGRVGTTAARLLVRSFGGWWQLMMHPKNIPSHSFWRQTFDAPGFNEVKLRRGPRWYDGGLRGTVMTFKVDQRVR